MFEGRDVLLDTGPLVAFLDGRDQWHAAVRDAWPRVLPRCVVPEAVVVEATHLIGRGVRGRTAPLELLLANEVPVIASHLPLHEQCVLLMRQYADVPMDYADATLVALADRLRIRSVFTCDRRGFRTYRTVRGATLSCVGLAPEDGVSS